MTDNGELSREGLKEEAKKFEKAHSLTGEKQPKIFTELCEDAEIVRDVINDVVGILASPRPASFKQHLALVERVFQRWSKGNLRIDFLLSVQITSYLEI